VAVVDVERRQDADDIVAARHRQQAMLVAQMRHEGAGIGAGLQLDAEHQAQPTHLLEQMIVIRDQLLQCAPQPIAGAAHVGEEFVRADDVQHRLTHSHRQRIAAIGRAVRAEGHAPSRLPRWRGRRRAGSPRRCPWRRS
jgi:hypothetical protein